MQGSAYIARCVLGPWRCLSDVGVVDVSVEHVGLLAAVALVATLPALLTVVVGLAEAILTDQDTSAILGALVGLLVLDVNIEVDVTLLGFTGAPSTFAVVGACEGARLDKRAGARAEAREDIFVAVTLVSVDSQYTALLQHQRKASRLTCGHHRSHTWKPQQRW
jgi:hypothetical protein